MPTISNSHSRILNLAGDAASHSQLKNRHGCVITKGKKKIAVGYNHDRSVDKGKLCCSFHAEKDACHRMLSLLFHNKGKPCLLWDSPKDKKSYCYSS